jgi:hypothetical protein
MSALGATFADPDESVDSWLNRIHDFHAGRKSRRYASAHWRVKHILEASAEYCAERATRLHEAGKLDTKRKFADLECRFRNSSDPQGDLSAIRRRNTCLRRDRYPFCYWLFDHAHERLADPKAELDYWTAHVWKGFHILIENCERLSREGMAWANRHEKLNFAIAGLSYDLAVLQANYVIDRGLRGEDAMRAFRDESAELLEEVTSSWRASCERLAVTFEDDTEEVKDLAQPFHRVRDDLRRLLPELPAASRSEPRAEAESCVPARVAEGKKRGRPQTIPDDRKAAALEIKLAGGSNKDAAKKLYNTTYPSSTQVKSTSTILREYQKKLGKSRKKPTKTRVE